MKIDIKNLQEMINNSISKHLFEMDIRQRIKAAASQDIGVSVEQLIDVLKSSGKKTITRKELVDLLGSREMVQKNLSGLGPISRTATTASLMKSLNKTGGSPVRSPQSFEFREGKISFSKRQLQEMVNAIVDKKLFEFSSSNNPIMAKREIISIMDSTARNFENEIIKTFNLKHPDNLSSNLQRKYLEIVEEMKAKMIEAAMSAVRKLINFPKEE